MPAPCMSLDRFGGSPMHPRRRRAPHPESRAARPYLLHVTAVVIQATVAIENAVAETVFQHSDGELSLMTPSGVVGV